MTSTSSARPVLAAVHDQGDDQIGPARPLVRGYVPGAWDMFHIGHLRLLERAKERCDVLLVGVVTDAVLHEAKNKWPVIPFEERLEVVGALKVVDHSVVDLSSNKLIAWERHHFDVLFKGDDWRGTAKGDRLEREMESVGVEVCYLPYTAHTSSTMLRRLVDDRIRTSTRSRRPRTDDGSIAPVQAERA